MFTCLVIVVSRCHLEGNEAGLRLTAAITDSDCRLDEPVGAVVEINV
jgi:hypothetical protein